jgi:homoserine dehydrogenase
MDEIRLGLLGCGTVGGGVVRLLAQNEARLTARVGKKITVVRALVRDPGKERPSELPASALTTRPEDVLGDDTLDVVVEVMGGAEVTRDYVLSAIRKKKQVVTANKMLLALHGAELVSEAKKFGVDLAFEASVGGGIPLIRVLRDALASDRISHFAGIINGTSNFILTKMQREGQSFEAALADAQKRGYAEADPTLDVGGGDAKHKLAVLAMLAFGASVDANQIPTEGITDLEPIDHVLADRFGFVIKPLATGRAHEGTCDLFVHPALVRKDAPLANIGDVFNALSLTGEALGPCLLSGRGAGDMPTAVSVVADVLDVARAKVLGVMGQATQALTLAPMRLSPRSGTNGRFYLRFAVFDRPGVLAKITGALGERRVSIEQMVQQGGGDADGTAVSVVILTHRANEGDVAEALAQIASGDYVARPTRLLRVLD